MINKISFVPGPSSLSSTWSLCVVCVTKSSQANWKRGWRSTTRRYPRDRSCPTVRGYLPLSAVQAGAKAWDGIVKGTERSNKYYREKTMCKDLILKLKLNVWNIIVFSCFEIWALFCSLCHIWDIDIADVDCSFHSVPC